MAIFSLKFLLSFSVIVKFCITEEAEGEGLDPVKRV